MCGEATGCPKLVSGVPVLCAQRAAPAAAAGPAPWPWPSRTDLEEARGLSWLTQSPLWGNDAGPPLSEHSVCGAAFAVGSRTGTGTVLSNKRNGTLSRDTRGRAPVGPDHLFKGDSLHSAALLTAGEGAVQSGPAGPVGRGELRESGSRWRGGQWSGPCHGLRVPGLCQAGSVTPALPAPAFAERRGSRGWAGAAVSAPCGLLVSSGSSFPGLVGDEKDTALPTPSSPQGPRQGSGIPVPLLSHLTGPRAHFRAVRTEVMDWS